jgi:POT family proton-dependent oligopeptide transporter
MPLLGAYMADQFWGRFKTIQVSIGIALLGHIILIVSALPPVIVHPNGAIAAFAIGIVIMGIGVGGFKSNISPLIAEQCMLLNVPNRVIKINLDQVPRLK